MAFLQKTWKDRVAEYINRRVLTKEDGTTELVSVERSEGTISQEGDAFSAANMNDLEQRIANEFSEQNKNFEWKLVVEVTGKTVVNLPTIFNEIIVIATRSDGNVSVELTVPYIALFDTLKAFHAGTYGNDGYFTMAVFQISKTQIQLTEFRNNGSDQTTSAKIRVYCR